jgi:hypothetical protein
MLGGMPTWPAARVLSLTAALTLAPACGDDQAYCARARGAFEEVALASREGGTGPSDQARLDRIRGAFADLDEGAPDEIREDVRVMAAWITGVQDGEQLTAAEPPEVQAASARFAAWLGSHCDIES